MSPMKCLMINSGFDANWHRSRYSLKYCWNGFLISDSARSSTIFWWMGVLKATYSFSVYFPALKSRLSCPLVFSSILGTCEKRLNDAENSNTGALSPAYRTWLRHSIYCTVMLNIRCFEYFPAMRTFEVGRSSYHIINQANII